MKKALALVIGNSNYIHKDDALENSVNDATAMASAFRGVGIDVILKTDCTRVEFEKAIKKFASDLASYPTAIFYYAGHAFQIERENYLSAIDSDFEDEDFAKSSTFSLQLIIGKMSSFDPDVKIIIMDACRNNPLKKKYRSATDSLAPVAAPNGTLIAFSTSPGEKAADLGMGKHSVFTGNLLKHLKDPNVPIEVIFKRVRASVHDQTSGKQTPWEHTSMIRDFYFRTTKISAATELIYESPSLRYEQFVPTGGIADDVILGLLSDQFADQNTAAAKVKSLAFKTLSPSEVFLLGRAFHSAAHYGSFDAIKIMERITSWINDFEKAGENHFLNGILFEIYFDGKGEIRNRYFKTTFLDLLFNLQTNKHFQRSFKFLNEQLQFYRGSLFYLPGDEKVVFDINFKQKDYISGNGQQSFYYEIRSIKIAGEQLFKANKADDDFGSDRLKMEAFKAEISKYLVIPAEKISIISKFDVKEIRWIGRPMSLELSHFISERFSD